VLKNDLNVFFKKQADEQEDEFQLNESQIADFRAAFNIYDREAKGEIPTSILGTVMKNLGHNLKAEQLQECIEAVDGDGKLY
jgi:Ca2+-binding EF-hand superfamily protein